jgi:hypothetical protein
METAPSFNHLLGAQQERRIQLEGYYTALRRSASAEEVD